MVQCIWQRNEQFRTEKTASLDRILKDIPQQTQESLRTAVVHWLADQDPTPTVPDIDNMDHLLHAAWEEQYAIGWDNFMRARISRLWSAHIEQATSQHQATQWERQIARWIWSYLEDAWEDRNQILFGDTREASQTTLQQRLDPKIRDLYAQCQQLPLSLRQTHTKLPLADLLKKPPEYLTLWMTQSEQTLRSHRKAITKGFYGRTLHSYFSTRAGRGG
jgi:hypothetical protein